MRNIVVFVLIMAEISVSLAQSDPINGQPECFYCGSWYAVSRSVFSAPHLSMTEKTLRWKYCGDRPVSYEIIKRFDWSVTIAPKPHGACVMDRIPVEYLTIDRIDETGGPTIGLYIFRSKSDYESDSISGSGRYDSCTSYPFACKNLK